MWSTTRLRAWASVSPAETVTGETGSSPLNSATGKFSGVRVELLSRMYARSIHDDSRHDEQNIRGTTEVRKVRFCRENGREHLPRPDSVAPPESLDLTGVPESG